VQTLFLGFLRANGDRFTQIAIEKSTGLLYMGVSNLTPVVTAIIASMYLGGSKQLLSHEWLSLLSISVFAIAFSWSETEHLGVQVRMGGLIASIMKCLTGSMVTVISEDIVKKHPVVVVGTLATFSSLAFTILFQLVSITGFAGPPAVRQPFDEDDGVSFFAAGPDVPLCASFVHRICVDRLGQQNQTGTCQCMTHHGWDEYTVLVIFVDVCSTIATVVLLKELSAVSKAVCAAASVLPMYLVCSVTGMQSFSFLSFGLAMCLASAIAAYASYRYETSDEENVQRKEEDVSWVEAYR